MRTREIQYPKKTHEAQTAVFDSTRWNGFELRKDDIIIATWMKSGTTWMQQIVSQLVFKGREGINGQGEVSPWLDFRPIPQPVVMQWLEAQAHRRFIKTHLPIDALGINPAVKYIYVGRNPRDVVWSAYYHQSNLLQSQLDMLNALPGRVGPEITPPPGDERASYLYFLDHGELPGFPFGNYWDHVQGWWNARRLPNLCIAHYNNLKSDLRGEAQRIADFLGIEIPTSVWPAVIEHCSFSYMQQEIDKDDLMKTNFKDGGRAFVNKGTNGRWKDVLTPAEIARCDEVAAKHLTPDCAHWIKTGELPD